MAEAAKKGADKKSAEKDTPAESKSGKGKLLLLIVALLVVGAGGAGGAMFWMKSHAPSKAAAPKEEEETKPEAPALFVPLDPPFVVNFQAEQVVRFLQVAVQVMTHNPKTAELLKQSDPVIKNDLLLLFGGQKYEVLSTREGKEKLQTEALAAIRAIISKAGGKGDSVEALYFTSFVMQ